MRKLRLNPDMLRVDTFGTGEESADRGTVHARSGTEYTRCWGGCGQYSMDGGITCGYCAESEGCTHNVYSPDCVSYAVACPLTSGWTCEGSGC
jgi:hypothetical protein